MSRYQIAWQCTVSGSMPGTTDVGAVSGFLSLEGFAEREIRSHHEEHTMAAFRIRAGDGAKIERLEWTPYYAIEESDDERQDQAS